jgi:ankyrin repeat protein
MVAENHGLLDQLLTAGVITLHQTDARDVFTSIDFSAVEAGDFFVEINTVEDTYNVLKTHGIEPTYADTATGDTSAMLAVKDRKWQLFFLTAKYEQSLISRNHAGQSVLHYACRAVHDTPDFSEKRFSRGKKCFTVISFLLDTGHFSLLDAANDGQTPLDILLDFSSQKKATLRILSELDIFFRPGELDDVLGIAVAHSDVELVKTLLEGGAPLPGHARDSDDDEPFDSDGCCCRSVIRYRANPNAVCNRGYNGRPLTVLQLALHVGCIDIISVLVVHGADPTVSASADVLPPLQLACTLSSPVEFVTSMNVMCSKANFNLRLLPDRGGSYMMVRAFPAFCPVFGCSYLIYSCSCVHLDTSRGYLSSMRI